MNVSNLQYEQFGDWLRACSQRSVTLGFADIEGIIGAKLPRSAMTHSAWWSNSLSHPLARVWLEAGWDVPREGLNWGRMEITLERSRTSGPAASASVADVPPLGQTAAGVDRGCAQADVPTDWRDLLDQATRFPIDVERDAGGTIKRFQPQGDYAGRDEVPLSRYGAGSFCSFRVPDGISRPGVYLIVTGDRLAYVGECQNFSQRFKTGYGQISPKNCYKGGQETNCRVNKLILKCAESAWAIDVHFLEAVEPEQRFSLETACIAAYAPPWNRKG